MSCAEKLLSLANSMRGGGGEGGGGGHALHARQLASNAEASKMKLFQADGVEFGQERVHVPCEHVQRYSLLQCEAKTPLTSAPTRIQPHIPCIYMHT
jgi:hypothetical protein